MFCCAFAAAIACESGKMSVQGGGENGQHRPQQVVHVRENSDSAMEELFSVLKTNVNKLPTNSFKSKNLPPSFFNPPDPNRHSRENSQDNTFVGGHHHLIPQHTRSRSSPAQLPNTLSIPAPVPNHRPQHSVDLIDEMQMPTGWDRRYFK